MPPPPDTLLCSASPGEMRLALAGSGGIVELAVVREGHAQGGIWLGRVVELAPSVAFVDIGLARPGVIRRDRLKVGEAIIVQAQSDPRRDKGPKLTANVTLMGRYVIFSPTKPGVAVSRRVEDRDARRRLQAQLATLAANGEGLVARRHAAGAAAEDVAAEVAGLRETWRRAMATAGAATAPACLVAPDAVGRMLAENPAVTRIRVDDAVAFAELRARFPAMVERDEDFVDELDEALTEAASRTVALPSGGRIAIEETAAAVMVDVDTGAGPAAAANKEGARALARQMRLRNLSGQILLDTIAGPGGGWNGARQMARLLADDPVPAQVLGVTKSGMIEMVRERGRASLAEVIGETHFLPSAETVALAALRAVLREARSRPGVALVAAAPEVAAALLRLRGAVGETERRLGRRLEVREEPSRPRESFEVV